MCQANRNHGGACTHDGLEGLGLATQSLFLSTCVCSEICNRPQVNTFSRISPGQEKNATLLRSHYLALTISPLLPFKGPTVIVSEWARGSSFSFVRSQLIWLFTIVP